MMQMKCLLGRLATDRQCLIGAKNRITTQK